MNLYIYQNFSNYFNRKIKRYDTLAEYGTSYFVQANVNFNPNDGITTSADIGGITQYDGSGDYLLVVEDNEIVSRWYIMENQRSRSGQYKLSLRRDLVADFLDEVLNSTIYLEKGWISDVSDPRIFNTERYTPNQIKKNETPLMDKSKCKWLVGYVDKVLTRTNEKGETVPSTFWNGTDMETNISGNIRYDVPVESWASWPLYQFVQNSANRKFTSASNIYTTLERKVSSTLTNYTYIANKNGYVSATSNSGSSADTNGATVEANGRRWASEYLGIYDELDTNLATKLGANMTNKQYNELLALNGKIVYSQLD